MEFIRKSIAKIWEGFLQNIGVLITAFVLSGGYLFAINTLQKFQDAVRKIPSDYFLTPLVLLLVLFGVLIKTYRRQKEQLSKLEQKPDTDEREARFVTHFGVWWKIYPNSEYIEDFPYCSCCEPKLKLVQTDWHPDEVFKCSKTSTEYKLYDKIPREREQLLKSLYNIYFYGLPGRLFKLYSSELKKLEELNPGTPEIEITDKLFTINPLCRIPLDERRQIISKHPNPIQAYHFVERHFDSYKKYLKKNGTWDIDEQS